MGNFGSFNRGGGMGNMQQLMKQAQKMQQDMLKAQEELKELEVTGSASNMVEVTLTCDGKMTGISIKPEAVDPDDIEMLEDLIVAAFNDATEKAEEVKGAIQLDEIKKQLEKADYYLITDDKMQKELGGTSYQQAEYPLGDILAKLAYEKLKNSSAKWQELKSLYIQPPPMG